VTIKERLSASVDADLLEAAEQAVERGDADTVSAWVNDALRLKLASERRQQALAAFIAEYEAEHGEVTAEEMRAATRRARTRAVTVREAGSGGPRRRRGGGKR